jgi:hypothetical protein
MILSIAACIASLFFLLWQLQRDGRTLGLPFAYLAMLLLTQVPGAFALLLGRDFLEGYDYVALGIRYGAIASCCFVLGVWIARSRRGPAPKPVRAPRRIYWNFCVIGGWLFVYGLTPLANVPSVGALIEAGGAIWLLGVMLGLRSAMAAKDLSRIFMWTGALMVYPILMLLLGGFLSYGSLAIILVVSGLLVASRHFGRSVVMVTVGALVGVNLFVVYFEGREDIRQSVWGGAAMNERVSTVSSVFAHSHIFDPTSPEDLNALSQRLNQNLFIGLSASRLHDGEVQYLNGQSVVNGVLALVPRAFWPDKPVTGGSGSIVADMTGLQLNEDTSWGVGNVMEFYINFGLPGLVVGFIALGWLIATLDFKAADAERRARFGDVFLFFLPATALVQPLSSIVEISGSAASALIAAFGWRWVWSTWIESRARNAPFRPGPNMLIRQELVRRETDEPTRLRPGAEPRLP